MADLPRSRLPRAISLRSKMRRTGSRSLIITSHASVATSEPSKRQILTGWEAPIIRLRCWLSVKPGVKYIHRSPCHFAARSAFKVLNSTEQRKGEHVFVVKMWRVLSLDLSKTWVTFWNDSCPPVCRTEDL